MVEKHPAGAGRWCHRHPGLIEDVLPQIISVYGWGDSSYIFEIEGFLVVGSCVGNTFVDDFTFHSGWRSCYYYTTLMSIFITFFFITTVIVASIIIVVIVVRTILLSIIDIIQHSPNHLCIYSLQSFFPLKADVAFGFP